MRDTLIQQGVDLLLFGMGTVFVFLAVLVVATVIMSSVMAKLPAEEVAQAPKPAAVKPAVDARVMKIIQAAIDQHRKH